MNTEIHSVPKAIVELADTGESPVSASKVFPHIKGSPCSGCVY